jgi:hypothetical protein
MPSVSGELAKHRIDVNKGSEPIKQRLRRFSPDKKESNQEGDYEINGSRIYKRNSSSRLASESRSSIEKEHGRMAHVRRLHRSQQTLPKGPVRITAN